MCGRDCSCSISVFVAGDGQRCRSGCKRAARHSGFAQFTCAGKASSGTAAHLSLLMMLAPPYRCGYLSSLPPREYLPVFWSSNQLAELAGTDIANKAAQDRWAGARPVTHGQQTCRAATYHPRYTGSSCCISYVNAFTFFHVFLVQHALPACFSPPSSHMSYTSCATHTPPTLSVVCPQYSPTPRTVRPGLPWRPTSSSTWPPWPPSTPGGWDRWWSTAGAWRDSCELW